MFQQWDDARGYTECESEDEEYNNIRVRRHHKGGYNKGGYNKGGRKRRCGCRKPEPVENICVHFECPKYKKVYIDGSCGFEAKEIPV